MKRKKESVDLNHVYKLLFAYYGPQGWWPLTRKTDTKNYDHGGYHKADYTVPVSAQEKFEVVLGAVLTQNTSWINVSKALAVLIKERCTLPEHILSLSEKRLADLIRSSGYYNQKAKKLKRLAAAFIEARWLNDGAAPTRNNLLDIWGVGEETADSILLYAFGTCSFVIDAYTKRLLARLGLAEPNSAYAEVQSMFHKQLKRRYSLYNEYHALIVQHAKVHCRKKPVCGGCPLAKICFYIMVK